MFFGNVTEDFSLTIMWSVIICALTDILIVFATIFVCFILETHVSVFIMKKKIYNKILKQLGKEFADQLDQKITIADRIPILTNELNKTFNCDCNSYDYCRMLSLLFLLLFGMHVVPILLYRLCSWGAFSKKYRKE